MVCPARDGPRFTLMGRYWIQEGNGALSNGWDDQFGNHCSDGAFDEVISTAVYIAGGVLAQRVRRINIHLRARPVAPV